MKKFSNGTLGSSLQTVVDVYEAGQLYFIYPRWAYEVAKRFLAIADTEEKALLPKMVSRIRTRQSRVNSLKFYNTNR